MSWRIQEPARPRGPSARGARHRPCAAQLDAAGMSRASHHRPGRLRALAAWRAERPQDGDGDGDAACDVGAYERVRLGHRIFLPAGHRP